MHSLLGRFSLIFYIGCKHSMKFILSSRIARAIGTLKCISIAEIYGQFPHATLTPSGFGDSAMTLDMIAALKGLSVPAERRKVLQLGRQLRKREVEKGRRSGGSSCQTTQREVRGSLGLSCTPWIGEQRDSRQVSRVGGGCDNSLVEKRRESKGRRGKL